MGPPIEELKSPGVNLRALAWAMFLGCSWTWCIGMFLPVLLVRDQGVWGWVVFAIPNVLGAAAVGWVLAEPGRSERIVRLHAGACSAFSAVTIAFHVFFVLWFVPRLVGLPAAASAFALVAIYLLLTASRGQLDLPAAAGAWIISLTMLALFLRSTDGPLLPGGGEQSAIGAAWLAPVCIFGFALCPYLDLTFHRARQHTTAAQARIAFGIGFGVCFLAMIVFSLLYAAALRPLLGEHWRQMRLAVAPVVGAHMIVQTAFTLAVHGRAFAAAELRRSSVLALLIMGQVALFLALASYVLPRYHGLDPGELVYRLFMVFYGLAFPAYVWVCMVPGRDGQGGVTPAKVRAMVLAIAAAAPMYWMGFIEGRMVWLVPGLGVVLASRYLLPMRQRVAVGGP